jgi:hypothetical protein
LLLNGHIVDVFDGQQWAIRGCGLRRASGAR